MNEDLQKALAEFVKTVVAGFSQGKDFVLAQAPDVIQQLIRWNFWLSLFWVGGGLIWLMIALVFFYYRYKRYSVARVGSRENEGVLLGVSMVITGVPFSFIIPNLVTALQIYVAPKVWLLEWAVSQLSRR